MDLRISNTKEKVAQNFADYLIGLIHSEAYLHIALSGGSTPKIVFDELASRNISKNNWEKVRFYWGDERCVPPKDNDSNYKMTKVHLLSKIDIPEKNIHRIKGENDPKEEARRYANVLETELPKFEGLPKFDLVILGMGDDGHTASIFPHEKALWFSKDVCEVAKHPETGQKRITITGETINNSERIVFLVTGANKAEKVAEVINRNGKFKSYPASLVGPKSGNLIWFLDNAAASHINQDLS